MGRAKTALLHFLFTPLARVCYTEGSTAQLTKGQDVQHPTITAEQLTDAMLDSVSGMEGATPEALEQLRNGLLGILQSAAEQENAHEADE